MVDGAASLMATFSGFTPRGSVDRARNECAGLGAPYYDVYECADGRYIAVAPIEMKFRREFLDRLGLLGSVPDGQDRSDWPQLRAAIDRTDQARPGANGWRCSR